MKDFDYTVDGDKNGFSFDEVESSVLGRSSASDNPFIGSWIRDDDVFVIFSLARTLFCDDKRTLCCRYEYDKTSVTFTFNVKGAPQELRCNYLLSEDENELIFKECFDWKTGVNVDFHFKRLY